MVHIILSYHQQMFVQPYYTDTILSYTDKKSPNPILTLTLSLTSTQCRNIAIQQSAL